MYRELNDEYARAVQRSLSGRPGRLRLVQDARSGRYAIMRVNNIPLLLLGAERPSVDRVKHLVDEALYKGINGLFRPEEADKSRAKEIDALMDATAEDRRRAVHEGREEWANLLGRQRTDGKGPNGGTKFYGPIMDR